MKTVHKNLQTIAPNKTKKKLEEKGLLCLSISPTIRSFHSKNDVSLFRKITRFIVGKSIKALKCVRPTVRTKTVIL